MEGRLQLVQDENGGMDLEKKRTRQRCTVSLPASLAGTALASILMQYHKGSVGKNGWYYNHKADTHTQFHMLSQLWKSPGV